MVNRLVRSNSPYLLQHAENPVDWYPWSQEAFDKAKQDDKPIFLSIGYSACHWCHVMAHESFEDPETAQIMNENFINIKVDREERPDVDNVYINSVVAMTGQGGWPTSVFLTPDGLPFFGGTYFPSTPRYNLPSFREVLLAVAKAWREDRLRILEAANRIKDQVTTIYPIEHSEGDLKPEDLDRAALVLAQTYDWDHGGWGKAPKFPQPMAIEFLLRRASRGDRLALEIGTHALKSMARGGMYDVIGGGFARYSTDNDWLVPHFEKMLYDNALLSSAYLHAYLLTGDLFFRRICEQTLNFIKREMMSPTGGFYASLDADTEEGEGAYYLWTLDEIKDAISNPADLDLLLEAYDISEAGNYRGKIILQRKREEDALSRQFNLSAEQLNRKLIVVHSRLLEWREKRKKPHTDDKIITAWNMLAVLAFSGAGRCFDSGCVDLAIRNFNFMTNNLIRNNTIFRSWRDGNTSYQGFLEDYASLILASLSLYQTTHDNNFYIQAKKTCEWMLARFYDANNDFYDTSDNQKDLFIRPKEIQDNALPSGSALATMALLLMSAFEGNETWYDIAMHSVSGISGIALQHPVNFSYWLCAIDFAINPRFEVAIIGDPSIDSFSSFVEILWSEYRPNVIAAISSMPPDSGCPPLLNDRQPINSSPTAFVCQNFICKIPVTDPNEFQTLLNQ